MPDLTYPPAAVSQRVPRPRHDLRVRRRRRAMASSPSAARRTCPRAAPTGATEAGGRRGAACATPRGATCRSSTAGRTSRRKRGGHGEGAQRHGASAAALEVRGTARHRRRGRRARRALGPRRARPARRGGARRARAGAATRPSPTPPARRRAWPSAACPARRAALELRLRLLADAGLVGPPQRGQELAARPPHRGRGPRWRATRSPRSTRCSARIEARRAPAGGGRHPGADRGRQRGCGAGPRVPRPRGALPPAGARARPGAARRLRARGQPRRRRGRARRRTAAAWRRCRGCCACPRPTS